MNIRTITAVALAVTLQCGLAVNAFAREYTPEPTPGYVTEHDEGTPEEKTFRDHLTQWERITMEANHDEAPDYDSPNNPGTRKTMRGSDRIQIKRPGTDELVTAPYEYAMRSLSHKTTLSTSRAIIPEAKVVVTQFATLTVKEGQTLTVDGGLIVLGTLVNNGTIIINGDVSHREGYADRPAATYDPQYNSGVFENYGTVENNGSIKITRSDILNAGTLTNSGSIAVSGGSILNTGNIENTAKLVMSGSELINKGGATLNNSGTLSASNERPELTTIANYAVKKTSGVVGAKLVNSGTIKLGGEGGVALSVGAGCTVENSGKITYAAELQIKGSISGSSPIKTQ